MKGRLGINACAVQHNIGIENGFEGVVDLIKMKAIYNEGENGEKLIEKEIPEKLKEIAMKKRNNLIDTLASLDPRIEELFFDEKEITEEEIKASIRRNVINNTFVPVFMGSAYKNKAVQLLLDGVDDYLPNPTEVENHAFDVATKEKRDLEINHKLPFVGYAFKLEENQFGQLTYVRVY